MEKACSGALALLILGGVSGCVGVVRNDASEVTTLEVAVYKAGMGKGCKDGFRGQGEVALGESICDCVLVKLNASLREDEWKRATYFAQQRKNREEAAVMASHTLSAAESCRATLP